MGSIASASIVYGVHLGGIERDDGVVGSLKKLGVEECDLDTIDSDLETYVQSVGRRYIAAGSWDGGRILCASATIDASDWWGSAPFGALPEVDGEEAMKLDGIGRALGREPGWHLVASCGVR